MASFENTPRVRLGMVLWRFFSPAILKGILRDGIYSDQNATLTISYAHTPFSYLIYCENLLRFRSGIRHVIARGNILAARTSPRLTARLRGMELFYF
jgi:hypothetical protein